MRIRTTRSLSLSNGARPSVLPAFFKAGTYVGTSGAQQTINLGFQADYIWLRSGSGIGPVRAFIPSLTTAYEALGDQNGLWVANDGTKGIDVNSTGFTTQNDTNQSTTYVYLAWKSSSQATQLINWTGNNPPTPSRLISHALGVQPEMVFHHHYWPSGGTGGVLISQPWLQGTLGSIQIQDFGIANNNKFRTADNSNLYNNVRVSSTDFSIGPYLNGNAVPYYAYLWASKAGSSKLGLYTGNGGTSGPSIDLGFAASAIIINRCDAVANGQLPTVWVGANGWNKYFNLPGSTINTVTNGIVINGNNFSAAETDNVNGVVYSYMAFK